MLVVSMIKSKHTFVGACRFARIDIYIATTLACDEYCSGSSRL